MAEQFGDLFDSLAFETRQIRMQAISPTHFVEYMLDIIGPVRTLYEQVEDQETLFEEWVEITEKHFVRNAGVIDYLLVRGEV